MKAIRHILGERTLGTLVVLVVAYGLALQSFAGALSRGLSADGLHGSLHIVCSSHGATTDTDDRPAKGLVECPCASLCRLAQLLALAIPAVGLGLIASTRFFDASYRWPADDVPRPPLRGFVSQPRGPPLFS